MLLKNVKTDGDYAVTSHTPHSMIYVQRGRAYWMALKGKKPSYIAMWDIEKSFCSDLDVVKLTSLLIKLYGGL